MLTLSEDRVGDDLYSRSWSDEDRRIVAGYIVRKGLSGSALRQILGQVCDESEKADYNVSRAISNDRSIREIMVGITHAGTSPRLICAAIYRNGDQMLSDGPLRPDSRVKPLWSWLDLVRDQLDSQGPTNLTIDGWRICEDSKGVQGICSVEMSSLWTPVGGTDLFYPVLHWTQY